MELERSFLLHILLRERLNVVFAQIESAFLELGMKMTFMEPGQ